MEDYEYRTTRIAFYRHRRRRSIALHYGQRAEITVTQDSARILIEIRDHGPGVPEDAFGSLFEPYVRLEHGRTSNAQGMGLGLGIARDIVHAHGGGLLLANHPEGGLCVTLSLPASPVHTA